MTSNSTHCGNDNSLQRKTFTFKITNTLWTLNEMSNAINTYPVISCILKKIMVFIKKGENIKYFHAISCIISKPSTRTLRWNIDIFKFLQGKIFLDLNCTYINVFIISCPRDKQCMHDISLRIMIKDTILFNVINNWFIASWRQLSSLYFFKCEKCNNCCVDKRRHENLIYCSELHACFLDWRFCNANCYIKVSYTKLIFVLLFHNCH